MLTTINDDHWFVAKIDFAQRAAIESIKPQLTALYQECMSIMDVGLRDYKLLGMISNQLYQLGVISAIEKELEEVKKERRVLHVSEFNKRITDIILKEPVPFIYERIGEKFKNYLIDEFQDTSDLQWKNLLPLIANSLAAGQFNLVVGDGKQAIYRFRNGQVEQFMFLPGLPAGYDPFIFGDAARALTDNYKPELLGSNFRSLPVIVEFNNDFFRYVSSKLDDSLRPIYDEQEQIPVPGKTGGSVSIEFLENDSSASFQELTLERIAELVSDLVSKGYSLKDIVILTRSNLQGSAVARFLIDSGVNVVSAEALLLAASAEVNFIVSVLGMLKDPKDMISAMTVIISLDLWEKLPGSIGKLTGIIQEGRFDNYLRSAGFDFNSLRLMNLPLYDLCEEIIRIFALDGTPYNPYIQFFLEFVSRQAAVESVQLPDLLEEWEEKKTQLSVVVPEGINAVRIMTIHKAKGLEFPVVIWPFATETLKSTRDQLWIEPDHPALGGLPVALVPTNKELENVGYADLYTTERNKSLLDMINLIYVAFTRPVERLYILTKAVNNTKSDTISLPSLLDEYLEQAGEEWKADGLQFSLGDLGASQEEKEVKADPPSGIRRFISASWQDRIRISRRAPHTWAAGQPADNQAWGNLVHECLSKIQNEDELDTTVEKMKEESQLSEDLVEELRKQVSAVIRHQLLRPFFSSNAEIKPEVSILLPEGNLLRPDRVILDGNDATILEFKTGKAADWHAKQLTSYADALERMGFKNIKRLLVYIDEQVKVEEI